LYIKKILPGFPGRIFQDLEQKMWTIANISVNLYRKTHIFLTPLNLLLKAFMGLRQFFCTPGNIKKLLIELKTIPEFQAWASIHYPLPLTLVRGYKIEMNRALAPIFFWKQVILRILQPNKNVT